MVPFAEHQIQIAFRQFVRAGETVFDAGANRGWLTKPLADLVGPKGHVVCFEPSPRNLAILRAVIREEALANTTLVEAALYHSSGVTLEMFENIFSNADSLYVREDSSTTIAIPSLTLDDYVATTGEVPSFIKVDIEGAEYDLLRGASDLIARHRPTFVLETKPDDLKPFELLLTEGYSAYNLMNLNAVTDAAKIFDGRLIEDLLYLPSPDTAGFYGRGEAAFSEQAIALEGLSVEVPLELQEGMNCIRLWGSCAVNPYEPLVIQIWVGSRIVVSTVDQLILTFRPYYQCVVYAPHDLTTTIRVHRQDNPFTIDRLAIRCVPMTPDEHRRHRTLAITYPFGMA